MYLSGCLSVVLARALCLILRRMSGGLLPRPQILGERLKTALFRRHFSPVWTCFCRFLMDEICHIGLRACSVCLGLSLGLVTTRILYLILKRGRFRSLERVVRFAFFPTLGPFFSKMATTIFYFFPEIQSMDIG